MYSVLAFGYEFLSEFVPFLIVLTLFRRRGRKYAAPVSKRYHGLLIVFALYIMVVFHVTGAGTVYDAMTFRPEYLQGRVNLIPFSREINVVGYFLNVVMFVPLGFLVPLIWKKVGKLSGILIIGFAFSLLIELSQMLCMRGTDVDDLILNTLGAAVGFLMYKGWDKVTNSRYQLNDVDTMELPAYIVTVYLGRFLLFHQLGLIKLVYGY